MLISFEMYIRGERERGKKKRERRGNLCSAANCHIDLVTWQTRLDLGLWGCGMCCISVRNCQPQRSSGERETWYQSGKPFTKGPARCLMADQKEQLHFWIVLAFHSYKCALSSSPPPWRGETWGKGWYFHGGCCSCCSSACPVPVLVSGTAPPCGFFLWICTPKG